MGTTAAAGTYALRVEIQSGNRPAPRNRRDVMQQASLTLAADTTRARIADGPPRQYAAGITLPGYSRPSRRGRPGQNAAWWPISRDSVVVMFTQGGRGQVQLRAAIRERALAGDIWYVSPETGSTFQLGTFTGSKSRT